LFCPVEMERAAAGGATTTRVDAIGRIGEHRS
jgi:hypothetical protein